MIWLHANVSGKIRQEEVKQLRIFQYLEGSQFFAWNCAPFLVALSSFATYTTVAGGVLDSQTAVVALTLFNTLRGPLFLLPFGIAAIIQGSVALKRIDSFLNAEELDKNSVSNNVNITSDILFMNMMKVCRFLSRTYRFKI